MSEQVANTSGMDTVQPPPTGLKLAWYRARRRLKTPSPYLMFFGVALWLVTYSLLTEIWKVPRFEKIPGPIEVITEYVTSHNATPKNIRYGGADRKEKK